VRQFFLENQLNVVLALFPDIFKIIIIISSSSSSSSSSINNSHHEHFKSLSLRSSVNSLPFWNPKVHYRVYKRPHTLFHK
jgi:hypothetical protein